MRMLFVLVPVAWVAALPSCSSSVTSSQATSDYASAYCDRLNACAPNKIRTIYVDVAACKERLTLQIEPIFSLPGSSASPDDLSDCGSGMRGLSCEDFLARKWSDTCKNHGGQLPNGSACGDHAQCQGRYCRKETGAACGNCATLGGPSGACETDVGCDVGLVCVAGTCLPLGKKGDSCDNRPCSLALACIDGKCTDPLASGEKCPQPPADNACDEAKGVFCDGSGTCADVKLVNPGETCGYVDGETVGCSNGGTCVTGANPHQGTCKPVAADGEACDAIKGPFCRPGAHCVSDVCKVDAPAKCQ